MGLLFALAMMVFWLDAPVVDNPKTGDSADVALRFVEDLRIGPSEPEDHLLWFGSRVMVDVNSKGEMFLLDAANHRVLRFAADGAFVGAIGRQGPGPGEFQALTNLRVLNDDRLVVYESRMGFSVFTTFAPDGEFLSQDRPISPARFLQAAQISPEGRHINAMYAAFVKGGGMVAATALMTRTEKKIDVAQLFIRQELDPFNPSKAQEASWWRRYLSQWFRVAGRQNIMAFSRDGHSFLAYTDEYRIQRLDNEYQPVMTITKDFDAQYRPEDERAELIEPMQTELMSTIDQAYHKFFNGDVIFGALEDAEFPARKPPIYGMSALANGELLVIHQYDLESGIGTGHIFDASGQFAGRVELPPMEVNLFGAYMGLFAKMVVRGDFAYVIEVDEDDDTWLVRYRLERSGS